MLKEFKEFAMKGNVLDMAIGVIIGGAFGKIVSSLVSDVLMPPIGLLLGKVDFSSLFLNLSGTPPAIACGRESRRSPDAQLWGVSANRVRLHHHCVRDLHVGQAGQPVQERSACGASATTARANQRREIIDGNPRRPERPPLRTALSTRFSTMREWEDSQGR